MYREIKLNYIPKKGEINIGDLIIFQGHNSFEGETYFYHVADIFTEREKLSYRDRFLKLDYVDSYFIKSHVTTARGGNLEIQGMIAVESDRIFKVDSDYKILHIPGTRICALTQGIHDVTANLSNKIPL